MRIGVIIVAVIALGIGSMVAFHDVLRTPFKQTEISERITQEFLRSKGRRMHSIMEAEAYCFIGVGADPREFARRNFPTLKSAAHVDQDDPLFLRSDSHRHLLLIFPSGGSYQVVPIGVNQINLANENVAECSADFVLTASRRFQFNEERWVLEVAASHAQ